ncbi:S8 family peptidase [Duganella sp. PWIR1]
MKRHALSLAVLALLSSTAHAAEADDIRRPYVVRLQDKPVAGYNGGLAGMAATQPVAGFGQRIDLNNPNVQVYGAYLDQKRSAVRATIANAPVNHEYKLVFNGFSASLTDAEVRQLKANSAVAAIVPSTPRQLLTNHTANFLGLDAPGGLWSQLGGQEHAGEGIVVGVIDGGIWPENPAYADRIDSQGMPSFDSSAQLAYGPPPAGWKGGCDTGEGFTASHCNNKLIGARYFDADFAATGKELHWTDFHSARDSIGGDVGEGGHGTHTSSTAAGNRAPSRIGGVDIGMVTGMAPRARVAMYKVCWSYNDTEHDGSIGAGCWPGDSIAAIEQAIADGVNVLNFSISGGATSDDPVEEAFRQASNAGVFVAAAAGNAGPKPTVNHVAPWLTTVAASSHDREYLARLTLGNGAAYSGASLNSNPLPRTALIRGEDAGVAGVDRALARYCFGASDNNGVPVLDAAKVAGKIVVCDRGSNGRLDKGKAVLAAGGAGMVMADDGLGPLADQHVLPAIHVNKADGQLIQAYAATAQAAADLSRYSVRLGVKPAPIVASFSSRGPSRAERNQIKPDLAAPGVDILAAVSPGMSQEQKQQLMDGTLVPPSNWAFMQGTSMATPHVAGLGALLLQRHPDWSPAAIKSALMTSAMDTLPDAIVGDQAGILPWAQGSGNVLPTRAADPGLVYDIKPAEYLKYLCAVGRTTEDCSGAQMQPFNLNTPSIAVANVLGTETVTRTVTNVGERASTYTASASISGYKISVSPSTLTLGPGESQSFTVTLNRTDAADNTWQYGQLSWTDGSHVVRSPIAAQSGPPVIATELVKSERASGMRLVSLYTGFTGKLGVQLAGMKEVSQSAPVSVGSAPPGSADSLAQAAATCNAGSNGVRVMPFTVPADTLVARFETFDRDIENNAERTQDVDLALMKDGKLLDYSMTIGSNESITVTTPKAGVYQLCVIGYDLPAGATARLKVSSAIVPRNSSPGTLKAAAPGKVYGGSTATVGLSWSGLAADKRYLGAATYLDPNGRIATTTAVAVDTDNAVPVVSGMERTTPSRRSEL